MLPTSSLLSLFEIPATRRVAIERQRRPDSVPLPSHPVHGDATINDNIPLIEKALIPYLDDGLEAADWYAILNRRVFFWVTKKDADRFLQAKAHEGRERLLLVLDTMSVAKRYAEQMELSRINSGSARRRPARRGLSTFTPLLRHDYPTWQKLRNKATPDRIVEVTVVGELDHITDHLHERHIISGVEGHWISLPLV